MPSEGAHVGSLTPSASTGLAGKIAASKRGGKRTSLPRKPPGNGKISKYCTRKKTKRECEELGGCVFHKTAKAASPDGRAAKRARRTTRSRQNTEADGDHAPPSSQPTLQATDPSGQSDRASGAQGATEARSPVVTGVSTPASPAAVVAAVNTEGKHAYTRHLIATRIYHSLRFTAQASSTAQHDSDETGDVNPTLASTGTSAQLIRESCS